MKKKFALAFLIAFGLLSFVKPLKSNFVLTGSANGIKDGTMVYLER